MLRIRSARTNAYDPKLLPPRPEAFFASAFAAGIAATRTACSCSTRSPPSLSSLSATCTSSMKHAPRPYLALLLIHRLLVVGWQNAEIVRNDVFRLACHPTAHHIAQPPLQIGLADFVVCVEFGVANVHVVAIHALDDRVVEITITVVDDSAFRSWLQIKCNNGNMP